MTSFCILCGVPNPVQWRWRKTEDLRTFSHKYCQSGPFVSRAIAVCRESQCRCCVQCVFQMRKRTLPGKPIIKQMWPMDAYLLWLLRMDSVPDLRQKRRFERQPSVYRTIEPLLSIHSERSWHEYNICTLFFRNAACAARFRKLGI